MVGMVSRIRVSSVICAVFEGDVEVDADEDALVGEVEVADGQLGHSISFEVMCRHKSNWFGLSVTAWVSDFGWEIEGVADDAVLFFRWSFYSRRSGGQ